MVIPDSFHADFQLSSKRTNREFLLVFHRVPLDTVRGYAPKLGRYITWLNDVIVLFAITVTDWQ